MDVISLRRNSAMLSRLKSFLSSKRFSHSSAEPVAQKQSGVSNIKKSKSSHLNPESRPEGVGKILDSRTLGIRSSMISEPTWIILKVLQKQGYEAYLVGGCVRDLILKRKPKDFDIVTTAGLKQVRRHFHRALIVGKRFPICKVHLKNTAIEVSSFETAAKGTAEKEKFLAAQMPSNCHKSDLVLWRDCMRRDFTVNSLFFNPSANKIYDYANGLVDLRCLKLQTLVPAHTSFTEDNARILRAVRIAARLCLSFSKEIETAVSDLSFSVLSISQTRIMMELNYMLSYGAAQPSLSLLQRLGLLEVLLPFHAAYLTSQGSKYGENSTMLMKLFNNLDRLLSCDRPADSGLWVGLFAFHVALLEKPQHPIVVLALASFLYYENWNKAVHFARQQIKVPIYFEPELLDTTDSISDGELAERVIRLALLIQESIKVLTDKDSLHEAMVKFPGCSCRGLVFVPKSMKSFIVSVFNEAAQLKKSNAKARTNFDINYEMLKKHDKKESMFVIGKIVLETMGCDTEVVARRGKGLNEKKVVEKQVTSGKGLNEKKVVEKQVTSGKGLNEKKVVEKQVTSGKGLNEKKVVEKQVTSPACPLLPAKKIMFNDNVFTRVKPELRQKKKELQLPKTKKQKVVKIEDDKYMDARHLLSQNKVAKMLETVENSEESPQCNSNFPRGDVAAEHNKKCKSQVSKGKGSLHKP